jgi:hypothetical protein
MIGGPLLASVVTAVVVVPLLGGGGSGPADRLAAEQLVLERAASADRALGALEEALGPGVDAGRAAAGRVVAGDEAPGPLLAEAASVVRAAENELAVAIDALGGLDGARAAAGAEAGPIVRPAAPGELDSIGLQLASTADAADAFADRRRRAAAVITSLATGLRALDAGDAAGAEAHVARAADDHAAVADWELGVPTLPFWVQATGELVAATEQLVRATADGDAAAAREAARRVDELADDADEADRALRIAIGEGGSAVTAAPLGRLADVLRRTAEARAAVASILQTHGR